MTVLIEFLTIIFQQYLLFMVADRFCTKRWNVVFLKPIMLLFCGLVILIAGYNVNLGAITTAINISVCMVSILILYKEILKSFISLTIWSAISFISELIAVIGMSLMTQNPMTSIMLDEGVYSIITMTLSTLIAYIIVYLITRKMGADKVEERFSLYQFICIVLAFLMIMNVIILYIQGLLNKPVTNAFVAYFTCYVVFFLLSVLFFFNRLLVFTREKEELALREQQNKIQNSFAEKIETMIAHLYHLNHDYRIHLQDLLVLMDNGMTEKAHAYYDELMSSFNQIGLGFIENQPMVSLLLMQKTKEAKDKNISFECDVMQSISTMVKETDLNSILGNILDNAFEAVEKLENDRWIRFTMERRNDSLFIIEENPMKEEYKRNVSLFISSKIDTIKHGYGLRSIHRIVEEYDGYVEIDNDDRNFKITVALPLQE